MRIGLTRNQLASIESGRVPLKWPEGLAICQSFDISQLWLWGAKDPIKPFIDLGELPVSGYESVLFTAMCKSLNNRLEINQQLMLATPDNSKSPTLAKVYNQAVEACVKAYSLLQSPEDRSELIARLPRAIRLKLMEIEVSKKPPPL